MCEKYENRGSNFSPFQGIVSIQMRRSMHLFLVFFWEKRHFQMEFFKKVDLPIFRILLLESYIYIYYLYMCGAYASYLITKMFHAYIFSCILG